MEIRVSSGEIVEAPVDTIAVGIFEKSGVVGQGVGRVNHVMENAISRLVESGDLTGKQGEFLVLHTFGRLKASRVVIVGLGKITEWSVERLRRITGEAGRFIRRAKGRRVAFEIFGMGMSEVSPELAAQAMTEGAVMGLYVFDKYFTKEKDDGVIQELVLVCPDASSLAGVERGCHFGRVMATAVNRTRDMVNEPANRMTPSDMADIAQSMAKKYALDFTVLERQDMERLGMGALLGVAQGSEQPPKFIVLGYHGDPSTPRTMGWLGKAITFDSGGISLKPAEGMELMKGDMSGGAAVMSSVAALAELGLRINVKAIVPATENMPSGRAQRPGDVVRAMNGKTIEIVTTDAEGRLILADALSYAVKEGLSPLVDVATLTGACHIALGDFCSGLFSNDESWQNRVKQAGDAAGECLWPMPMFDDYAEQIKSSVADIKNSGGRWGGAITAAKFLAEFVGKTPWAHIDIAGTAQADKERGYLVKGATGVGVRTLISLARLLTSG